MANPAGMNSFPTVQNTDSIQDLDFSLASDILKSATGTPIRPSGPIPPSAPPAPMPASEVTNTGINNNNNILPGAPEDIHAAPMEVQHGYTQVPSKLPPLANAVHPRNVDFSRRDLLNVEDMEGGGDGGEDDYDKVADLRNMLECPICLDTADKAPIYQCPEGHLICDDCNSRLVDCPQCGHALMNSRNRTAEELALKLLALRGDLRGSHVPGQLLEVSVSEPQKVRKGLFAHVAYNISTKIVQELEQNNAPAATNSYTVSRRYSEIVSLYRKLVHDYKKDGIIVPPPPEKSRLATVAVKISPSTNLEDSMASHLFEKRCLALDRYMKRLVKHPILRKDPSFRGFIQEKKVSKSLKVSKTFSQKMSELGSKLNIFNAQFSVSEHDPWFQTRQNQLKALSKQVREVQSNIKDMSRLKSKLSSASGDFQRSLATMQMTKPSRENSLGHVMEEVIDCHKTMSLIHEEQAKADELIMQLAVDYEKLVDSARDVLVQRRSYQKDMKKVQKGKNPLEEIEKIQKKFDKLSQTIRRELEHFDFVMRDEFQEVFTAYNSKYWQSLKKTQKV